MKTIGIPPCTGTPGQPRKFGLQKKLQLGRLDNDFWKNFRTAPYLIMHVHLTGDTLNNKAPYMDV